MLSGAIVIIIIITTMNDLSVNVRGHVINRVKGCG